MNPPITLVYYSAIGVCGLMALLNAARYRKRGVAALAMSMAFIVFGSTVYLVIRGVGQAWVIAGITTTFVLLIVDFVLRSLTHGEKDTRR